MAQEELKVFQAMEKSVMVVELNTTARECAKAMAKRGVSCAVITQRGRPVGIITERDLVSKVMAEAIEADKAL
ncbi:MAG TPA: CBS domain-containing protein, partial [Nitrososphaerales archaeon]|nr:CBS domain-containing protein [Nitrososphaerales archaeon]